jgi:hypothetical protein
VSGDYAYVADGNSGLAVIDISDPTNPGTPIYEDTTGEANDIYVSGDYAYVADGGSGLAVIQVRKRFDMEVPIISNAPSDITVEAGYTGQSLSWTATDANPDTYTIELQGTGIVAGPTAWTSGNVINYFIIDSVTFTVDDTTNPTITNAPSDLTVEFGYTGQSISWTATDPNPNTYTIELQGTGIVAGPTPWTSGNAINYNIPDGFGVGAYIYTVTFTDDYDHFITDSVTFTVDDTTNPTITNAPSDITVETGYTGQSISWTATDANPDTYTIELQGTGVVAGPTPWMSGNAINYNIPNGFGVGAYIYTVTFTDDYDHFITNSVTFTVGDTTNPTITNAPSDLTVEFGYTGQSISWTATDANPDTYTIELQGTGVVRGPTAWTSGVAITYAIPNGFTLGVYVYTVNFADDYGNFITDSVTFTVEDTEDTTNPVITDRIVNFTVEAGYTGQFILWTATDSNPDTYTIELQGSGIVAGPTTWSSGVAITYNIPDGHAAGDYFYTVNFTDDAGNSVKESVKITVKEDTPPVGDDPQIPFGNWYLMFLGISITALVFIQKRRK